MFMGNLKEVLGAYYKAHAKEIEDLVLHIHDHPELSEEEELAEIGRASCRGRV